MQGPPGPPGAPPPYGQQQYNYGPTEVMPQIPMMQPMAQPMQPGFAPGGAPRAPAVHMSGGVYVTFYVICMLATGALAALGSDPKTTEAIPFIPLPFVVWGIFQMVFVYKMWNAINDGRTKPSPGAALGLLFVPLFSLYWVFVVFPGYASRYNAYAHRHGIQVRPLGAGLFVAALLLGWVPLVGLVLWALVLGKVCGAVNALSPRR